MSAFLYCWTDKLTNKLYVGVHSGHENDGYVSSSRYFMEEYNKRPDTFSRQIIATGSHIEMLKLENIILKSAKAAQDSTFYNRHNGAKDFYNVGPDSLETRKKKSITWKRKGQYNCSNELALQAWRGQKHTEETKELMRQAKVKYTETYSNRMKMSNPMRNAASIAKMLETRRKNKEKRVS